MDFGNNFERAWSRMLLVLCGLVGSAAGAVVTLASPDTARRSSLAFLAFGFAAVLSWMFGLILICSLEERARLARLSLAIDALRRLDPPGTARPVLMADGLLEGFDPHTQALVASFAGLLYERIPQGNRWWAPVGLGMCGRVRRDGEKALAEVTVEGTTLQLVVEERRKTLELTDVYLAGQGA